MSIVSVRPQCAVCLDLEWDRSRNDDPCQRRLKVSYQDLKKSEDCQVCRAITHAISESRKPLEASHGDFQSFLESNEIYIILQDRWTVKVLIWRRWSEGMLAGSKFEFEFEMFRSKESLADISAFSIVNDVPPTLDLSLCTRFAESQIKKCNANHTRCQSGSTQMPSRLIYLGSDRNNLSLRLELSPPLQPYAALSHCWGDQSAIFTSTKANIEDLLVGIPWKKLPKSFQDAISTARSLHFKYLWIDSICIIQDDPSDWKIESIKMAQIYSGAYLTIAATGAPSSTFGCFFTCWHETISGVNISHDVTKSQSDVVLASHGIKTRYISRAHRQIREDLSPPVGGAPLWKRAWAFQERLLSNRVLHFHGEEMLWECRESRECECGFLGWTSINTPWLDGRRRIRREDLNLMTRLEVFEAWLDLVRGFTKLDISYEMDKLPAISGLAEVFQKTLDSSYVAGVWAYNIGYGLLWRKMPYQQSRRVINKSDQYVPSWSWASVELLSARSFGIHVRHRLAILLVDGNFRASLPASSDHSINSIMRAGDAKLDISGLAVVCTLKHQHELNPDFQPDHVLSFIGGTQFIYTDISCTKQDPGEELAVICLLVGYSEIEDVTDWDRSNSGRYFVQFSLVLQLEDTGVYKRVGMAEHDSRKGWFENAEVKSFKVL